MRPNRRDFLRLGLGSGALVAAGAAAPPFLVRSAVAVAPPARGERILVVLYLGGGNDGLNTLVPYKDPDYRKYRPGIHLAAAPLHKLDDRLGLHPGLGGWAKLFQARELAAVQAVGYPNADRSHFESMSVWFTARTDPQLDTPGWLARWAEARPAGRGGDAPAMHVGVPPLPQALAGGRWQVPSVDRPERFIRRLGLTEAEGARAQREALDRASADGKAARGSLLEFVHRSTAVSYASSARLERVLSGRRTAAGYPEVPLARRLAFIAQMIEAGLKTSVYYAEQDGYDTHVDQLRDHERLLLELGESTRAFLADLHKAGEDKRVLVLVFSEFGRRVRSQGSGTDHGSAGPVFLLGPAVRPGLHGPYPDLQNLDQGDLKPAIDFRRVYATLLDKWLGVPGEKVLGAKYEHLPVL